MIHFDVKTHLPNTISLRNKNRFLVEGWIFGSSLLKTLYIRLGEKIFFAEEKYIYWPEGVEECFNDDPNKFSLFSGFSIPVILEPVSRQIEEEAVLVAEFKDGEKFEKNLGLIELKPYKDKSLNLQLPPMINKDELLVICMTTYNPGKKQFERQIESIRKQDFKNWICIISDDNSSQKCKKDIKEIISNDPRFYLIENDKNMGFYHNFERCLELVPKEATYVALADQDDYWYPNKISECLKKLVGQTQLVYCDMKIVHEDGRVISDTYWKNRKNYYKSKNLDLLTIANTVTGAASVFRANLLNKVLPFPPRYGDVYHDQWIAVIAVASGGIDYVNKPLYDYMQSGENVIGHYDFTKLSLSQMIREFFPQIWVQGKGLKGKIKGLIRNVFSGVKNLYKFRLIQGKHIETITRTALIRDIEPKFMEFIGRPTNILGLLKMHIKVILQRETTNGLELKLLFSNIINGIYSLSFDLLRKVLKARNRNTSPIILANPIEEQVDPGVVEFKRKFAGRNFVVASSKQYVNVFLSKLDPRNFFGGYIGMYNFAKKFHDLGYLVRIIYTDQRSIPNSDIERIQNHDLTLKEFLQTVEFVPCFTAEQEIEISDKDIFVATSWWTAHIAQEAVSKTKFKKFIYLIQDYEPIFYEHGAYRVLAEGSYTNLEYYPYFSTDILQTYFAEQGLIKKSESSYFKNPVLDFELTNLNRTWGKKRILFYARPQPHNARNLYPIGLLMLDRARELGFFKDDEWEVIGIGGDVGQQKLPSGLVINHIGKFNMQDYKKLLPQHDLGIALMDSPHPSLLPTEMASAGMLVVTNTYGIKDERYFSNISKNIKAVSPDIEAMTNALVELSKKVDDFDQRLKNSKVNWPHGWDEALPKDEIKKAISAVVESEK